MTHPVEVCMASITKRFGGVLACDDIDFMVHGGEVHALLGENGAGKSTLMNILSGVITDYDGELTIDGEPVRFHRPADAQRAGIATIHQELDLVPGLSVAENLTLGREPRTRLGTLDRRRMVRTAGEQLRELGADLDPRCPVGSLRVGEQQLVEVAKALSLGGRVLVMDEPTAALADAEVERLFQTIRQLRRRGVGIVYISHRMEEIEVIADRATILRNGRVAGSVDPKRDSRQTVVSMMVGREVETLFGRGHDGGPDGSADGVLLQVDNLAVRPKAPRPGRSEPSGVDLTVRSGEIVGLAGLMGAGRTELLETLFGAGVPATLTGTVTLAGRPYLPTSPRAALASGIGFVPEDRRGSALVLEHPVGRSIALSALHRLTTAGVVRPRRERAAVAAKIRELSIKTSSAAAPVGSLSGGNQQKVVFARQLLTEPRLLLLDEPTRGVDIGAKAEIYRLLQRFADDGMGILLASSELPELLGVCDRIVVLRHGRVVAQLSATDATGETVLAAAMGNHTVDGPNGDGTGDRVEAGSGDSVQGIAGGHTGAGRKDHDQ